MTLRYLDVCSGYSAWTLGSAGLGFQCVGYSEIEPFPRAILEQRHGAVAVDWGHRFTPGSNVTPLFGDFTQIEAHHVGPVDLLTGGTPCQAFSVAGKRLGLDDPRGNLTLEFLALARRVRARWLVWENVPGILSHDRGRTMGTFLRLLGELGYGWAYRVLDAQYIRVDGYEGAVPQRRRRVFVVAHLGDAAGPAAVLFERESLRGDPAPRRRPGEGASHAVAPGLVSSGRGVERAGETRGQDPVVAVAFGGNDTRGPIDVATARNAHGGPHGRLDFDSETFVATTLRARDAARGVDSDCTETLVAHSLRAEGIDAREDGTVRGTPLAPIAFAQNSRDEVRLFGGDGQTVGALGAEPGMKQQSYVAQPEPYVLMERGRNGEPSLEYRNDGTANALLTPNGGRGGLGVGAIAHGWAVRRLTPTECERLMGVPDDFTAITYRRKPAADGPRYKALGNSQAANVMRWIAHGVRMVEDAKSQGRAAA